MNGQTPEIDILSRIKKMCKSKIGLTTQSLKDNMDTLENSSQANTNEELDKAFYNLDQIRNKMIDKINDHFNKLKQDLANNFRQSTNTIRDSNELKMKIRNVLSELETL